MGRDRIASLVRSMSASVRGVEMPLGDHDADPVTDGRRDGVAALEGSPAIVSVSDVHGYLDEARSALLALADHPDYDPVVTADGDGRLHWAGNDYALVFNGDLVDRGPANAETLALVARLFDEAPTGRVRVTFGNHEMGVLVPDLFGWGRWYSGRVDAEGRRAFCEAIEAGHVVAAWEGYEFTYAHAGQAGRYDVTEVNDALVSAARRVGESVGTDEDEEIQRAVVEDYPVVLGLGAGGGKGQGAGIAWLGFRLLDPGSPPQVVGHTRHDEVTKKGNVVCENVIRANRRSAGGEAVLVETPEELAVVRRDADGGVSTRALDSG